MGDDESRSKKKIQVRLVEGSSHPVDEPLQTVLATLNSIRLTYNAVMPRTAVWLRDEHKRHAESMTKFEPHAKGSDRGFVASSAHEVADVLKSLREVDDLRGTQIIETLQRSLYTQVFCEFDSFIGALLTVIYTRKSELLKGISREIALSELLDFESLDAVKLNMLQKEVETFRRDSYVEQFAALERKFGFKTLRQFTEWGEFVELSQRRNILTHNGGKVNDQYLLVCDREGYVFAPRPNVGDELQPDAKYIGRAIRVVSKVAFMLTHTLWRKIFPDEASVADESANDTIYHLLEQERWQTATALSEFVLSEPMRKSLKEIDLRVRIVNCAIGLKFCGRDADAAKILNSIDWSATYRDFRLAVAVLKDDFASAKELMISIGRSGEIFNEIAYHRFPLFHKFRQTPEFQEAYEQIYGVSFVRKAVEEAKEVTAKVAEAAIAAGDLADGPSEPGECKREEEPQQSCTSEEVRTNELPVRQKKPASKRSAAKRAGGAVPVKRATANKATPRVRK